MLWLLEILVYVMWWLVIFKSKTYFSTESNNATRKWASGQKVFEIKGWSIFTKSEERGEKREALTYCGGGGVGVNQWDEEMLTLWRLINKHETMRLHAASCVNITQTRETTFRVDGDSLYVLSNFRHVSLLIDFLKRGAIFENRTVITTYSFRDREDRV